VIELERVPVAAGVAELAARLKMDVYSLACACAFGEDYELLAAVPEPGRFSVIGRCEKGEGVVFLSAGEPVELRGWDHFL
jgi:thiamine monophosphate kinase